MNPLIQGLIFLSQFVLVLGISIGADVLWERHLRRDHSKTFEQSLKDR